MDFILNNKNNGLSGIEEAEQIMVNPSGPPSGGISVSAGAAASMAGLGASGDSKGVLGLLKNGEGMSAKNILFVGILVWAFWKYGRGLLQ